MDSDVVGLEVPSAPPRDVACQTDPPLAVPLPMQYPANLTYAQSMLAVSVSQLQQTELCIAQLRTHLQLHELRGTAAAMVARKVAEVSEAAVAGASAAVGDASAAPDAAADAQAPAAAPEGGVNAAANGAQPAQPQALRVRRRIAAAMKVALLMVVMDMRGGWFYLYFFAAFLYIGGLFDPFIEWLMRPNPQQTLEQQLIALRRRQQEAAAVAAAAEEAAVAAAAADARAGDPQGQASPGDGQAGVSSGGAGTGVAGGVPATGAEAGTGPDAAAAPAPSAAAGASATAETQANAERRAPHWQRAFYQLVIMFFLTLMPWWNPNPYYL
mmetsp:Transcript_96297/g.272226  ORF Transcript_96297/g.272226 Transcript_96297/m.272226 type:complete len:327 (+) Transcript_96297:170-1150(+)